MGDHSCSHTTAIPRRMSSVASDTGTGSSSSDSEADVHSSRWRSIAAAVSVAVIAVAGSNIAGAYVRGNAAAAAAIRQWEKAQEKYDPSSLFAEALKMRAGRDAAGSNRHVENTAFEWARKIEAQRGMVSADFNDSIITDAVPKDLNEDWGTHWLKVEVNRVLKEGKAMINKKMAQYLEDPSLLKGIPMIEWQHGLETMIIENIEAPWVKVNTVDGTAFIGVEIKAATQGPLGAGGYLLGDKYPFTLKVSKLWWGGKHAKVDVKLGMPFAFTGVKAGWIQGGLGNLDGVCYGKTGKIGGKEDKACTSFMNKKLNKDKGEMVHKMSQELTKMMQKKLDNFVTGFMSYDYDYHDDR